MTKGLVQMVEEAMGKTPELPPVQVSDDALRAMSACMRQWSGWPTAMVKFGKPTQSPWAEVDQATKTFVANVDALLLNPNRVLLTVTPFRLKQEAVLTGALLHEAGHARHSRWLPKNAEEKATRPAKHSDGTDPSKQTVALARLLEEPRVEGLMFRDADRIGATGLGWTMRASAAHLVPMTALSADPNRAIMDLIQSWVLRAGRQYAINATTQAAPRNWVQDFTTLLHNVVLAHLTEAEAGGADIVPAVDTRAVIDTLIEMTRVTDDTGPTMLDMARSVLTLLFPETDPDEVPEVDDTHKADDAGTEKGDAAEESESESGDDGEGDDEGADGEGNTEPEDEGSGTDPGAGDSGQDDAEPDRPDKGGEPTTDTGEDGEQEAEQKDSGTEGQPEDGEPGEGDTEPDSEGSEGEPESDEGGATSSTEEDEVDTDSPLAKALADMEAEAKSQTSEEVEEEEQEETDAIGSGAGLGDGNGSWRTPTKAEREMQKGAEQFLRELISPSESTKVTLTESPSATVDGAALAAWRAGGQVRDPRFFRRIKRTIEPSPPVRVAILVDVSISMSQLQKPSSQLSWALGAAALDLRNFAGRGQQVESCMIHWGTEARVIQRNGEMLPGLREWSCNEGTSAMGEACELVEAEMPGFFDIPERPMNRLLVQFTDWELGGGTRLTIEYIKRALASGVNMLTIAPEHYSERNTRWGPNSDLPGILAQCDVKRGMASLTRYDRKAPGKAWEDAVEMLGK